MRRTSRRASPKAKLRAGRSASRPDALIEAATVDAYDESEQRAGVFTKLDDHLARPFSTEVLSMTVTVETDRVVVQQQAARRDTRIVPIGPLLLCSP
jgi:hypothetical protein